MINSTIFNNWAHEDGGGLFLKNDDGYFATLLNTTVTDNRANNDGGGLFLHYNNGTSTLANSIIANSSGGGDCVGSSLTFAGMNLIEDNSCDAAINGQLTGDPKLDPAGLQLNTGSMPTIPLLSDSPAIDVGDNSLVTGISYDQRGAGFPRILGSQVDLGAYEFQSLRFLSGISVTSINEFTVAISWSDDNTEESGYRIFRRVSDTWSEIGVVAPNTTSFNDTTIDCQTDITYEYFVQAYRDIDNSTVDSLATSFSTGNCVFNPPTSFVASGVTDEQVDMTWTDNSSLESAYVVSRSLNNINWTTLTSLPANTTNFVDTTVECERLYYYRLEGYQELFDRYTDAATFSVNTGRCNVTIPDAITTTNTVNEATISWNPIPPQQTTQIIVERAEQNADAIVSLSVGDGLNWQVRAQLPGGTSFFTEHDLRCGMIYWYRGSRS